MGFICLYVLIQKSGQKTAKSHLCSEVELDKQDISQNDASIHKVLNDLVKTVNKLNASVINISDEMNTIRDKLEIKNHQK